MGRALKVGDYVQLTPKGLDIMGAHHENEVFRIKKIGFEWHNSNRKSYSLLHVDEDDLSLAGEIMYRTEIRLVKPPKVRVTFKTWTTEMENSYA